MKIATMCSGIGSPEQALRELQVPHENVFACEKDKFARQTYLSNFKPGKMYLDMTAEAWDLPEQYADLIVAGIPCQSFSLAGKRMGENDPRGLLIYDFIRYVKAQRPKVFIIENVKGLLSDAGGATFSKWCDLLGSSRNGTPSMFTNPESCGYNLHYRVLNAKNYGLPQNRERVFIIGIRPDLKEQGFRWPKPIVLKDRLIDLLETDVDEKYYLSDTMMAKLSECGTFINQDTQASQVHNVFGISPAVSAGTHGYAMGYIQESRISSFKETENAIRAVKSDGSGIQEHFYNKPTGISNTISKSHKGKVIQLNPSKESGGVQPYQQNRVYDSEGISPAIDSKAGVYGVQIVKATKQGFATASNGDSISVKHPNSKTRRGRVGKGIANTIDTIEDCVVDNYLIRRYTPLETMRLMGYPDSFTLFNKVHETLNNQGINMYISDIIKDLLCQNVRFKTAIEKVKQKGIALCTIKEIGSMGMLTSYSNTQIGRLKNALLNIVITQLTPQNYVSDIIHQTENGEHLLLWMKEKRQLEKISEKQVGDTIREIPKNIDMFIKISLEENFYQANQFIISILINLITSWITFTCVNHKKNTMQFIISYKNSQVNYTDLELFHLKMGSTSFVSETQTYKQAGNSIPVHMMKAILRQLIPILTA